MLFTILDLSFGVDWELFLIHKRKWERFIVRKRVCYIFWAYLIWRNWERNDNSYNYCQVDSYGMKAALVNCKQFFFINKHNERLLHTTSIPNMCNTSKHKEFIWEENINSAICYAGLHIFETNLIKKSGILMEFRTKWGQFWICPEFRTCAQIWKVLVHMPMNIK